MCCTKTLNDRVLRESTTDPTRIDYGEIYGEIIELFPELADLEPAIVDAMEMQKKSRVKTREREPIDEAAKDVLREFERALMDDGFKVGANRDGTAYKYSRYMKMLFDHKIFSRRADFFRPGARAHAHKFYRSAAEKKAGESNTKTSAIKLYRNYANGFDKFVLLCSRDGPEPPEEENFDDVPDDVLSHMGLAIGN